MARERSPGSSQSTGGGPAELVLRASSEAGLSARQLEYNRLIRRIGTLQRRLVKERDRLESLLSRFHSVAGPIETRLSRRSLELAQKLSEADARWKFRVDAADSMRHLILELVGDVIAIDGPVAPAVELRAQWLDRDGRDERARNAAIKKQLRREFRDEFGFDADVEDDGDDSTESFERFRRNLGEAVRRADEEQDLLRAEKERDKRNLRKRRGKADQESVRLRSVRTIYLSLAKRLHPDANSAADERADRESDMKRAAEAYREENLVALLELEAKWGDGEGSGRLPDDLLAIYIATLRRQTKTLESELRSQASDPRYARIFPVTRLSSTRSAAAIDDWALDLRGDLERVEVMLEHVKVVRGKRRLAGLVEEFLEQELAKVERDIERAFADED